MDRRPSRFKNRIFALSRPFILPKRDPTVPVSGNASATVFSPGTHDLYRPDMRIYERRRERPISYRNVRGPDLAIAARKRDTARLKKPKRPAPPRLTYRPKISIPAVRLRSRAARPRKKRLSWGSSATPDVAGYRLYWAVGQGVDYEAEHADLGKVTTILLPDDIAAFPQVAGRVEIGVTALNQHGNESDMTVIAASVDFRAPEPPEDLRLEDL
jgi:hypothetical protein